MARTRPAIIKFEKRNLNSFRFRFSNLMIAGRVRAMSAQIPTSNKTRLNEFKRSVIHLGANPDQQRNKT